MDQAGCPTCGCASGIVVAGPDDAVIIDYGPLLGEAHGEDRGQELRRRLRTLVPEWENRLLIVGATRIVVLRGRANRTSTTG